MRKEEGAELLTGGEVNKLHGELETGYYIKPTIFKGNNKIRIFHTEIFGPAFAATAFTKSSRVKNSKLIDFCFLVNLFKKLCNLCSNFNHA